MRRGRRDRTIANDLIRDTMDDRAGRNHVAALSAPVYPWDEISSDRDTGINRVIHIDVETTACGTYGECVRETELVDRGEPGMGLSWINVNDQQARTLSGCNANIRVRINIPPLLALRDGCGRIVPAPPTRALPATPLFS